jgi:hypothetical protein
VKALRIVSVLAFLSAVSGCKPLTETVAYFQHNNLKFGIARSTMTITFGDGSVNARVLMDAANYDDEVCRGRVTVRYREGLKLLAEEAAEAYGEMYEIVTRELGINWCFDLEVRLVCVEEPILGFAYVEKLSKRRRLVFPLFVIAREGEQPYLDPRLAATIAHEVTEASMIAPCSRRSMVMSDLFGGPFCVPFGTRWFRDGVSDHAGDHLGRRLFGDVYEDAPPDYQKLASMGADLLRWSNCSGSGSYAASRALVQQVLDHGGPDALPKVMAELEKLDPPDGSAVRGAIMRATGLDVRSFLECYSPAWLGIVVRNTCVSNHGTLLCPDNQVQVTSIHANSPASRRGIQSGDIIVTLNGIAIRSVAEFLKAEARTRGTPMARICLLRGNERLEMNIRPTSAIMRRDRQEKKPIAE